MIVDGEDGVCRGGMLVLSGFARLCCMASRKVYNFRMDPVAQTIGSLWRLFVCVVSLACTDSNFSNNYIPS